MKRIEKWMPVKEYEGLYEVSCIGNVKSLYFGKEKILTPVISSTGYCLIRLYKNGKIKGKNVHQLVAESFLNHVKCGHKLVVDHINDNKIDNRVENLQIITQRSNAYKTQGKYSSNYKGVSWEKNRLKWKAQLNINGVRTHLGLFNCELGAMMAYNNKLKEIEL